MRHQIGHVNEAEAGEKVPFVPFYMACGHDVSAPNPLHVCTVSYVNCGRTPINQSTFVQTSLPRKQESNSVDHHANPNKTRREGRRFPNGNVYLVNRASTENEAVRIKEHEISEGQHDHN